MSANDELQAHTCEKILQEYGDIANNVALANSQDLTEQWKKGELQGGWYFLEFENGSNFPVYYCGFNREFEFGWDWKISKVLARCSCEEFDNITKCYLSAHERAEKSEKENQQLKELLITCKYCTLTLISKGVSDCNGMKLSGLITKIDNAIGEK